MGHRACHYKYFNERYISHERRFNFATTLADVIMSKAPLLYMDEAAVNMWLRGKKTWSTRNEPVRMNLNVAQGEGVTIMGCIGNCMSAPYFELATSTNNVEFQRFLTALRGRCCVPRQEPVYLVLDNASSHHNNASKQCMAALNFRPLFIVPYSPEFNSIERLWSVIKRRIKARLALAKDLKLSQEQFEHVVLGACNEVT